MQDRFRRGSQSSWSWSSSRVTSHGDAFDLDQQACRLKRDPDRGAGGIGFGKILAVDRVELGEVLKPGQENGDLDDIAHREAGILDQRSDILESLMGLFGKAWPDNLSRIRIDPDLTGDEQHVATDQRRTERRRAKRLGGWRMAGIVDDLKHYNTFCIRRYNLAVLPREVKLAQALTATCLGYENLTSKNDQSPGITSMAPVLRA